jgi:parvulin-like peptidyl-prolyl isomerase
MKVNKILLSSVATLMLATTSLSAADKVYVTLNGEDITSKDITQILKDPRIQFETLPANNQKQILDQIVTSKLLGAKALTTNVVTTKEYKEVVEREIKTLKSDIALQMWVQELSKEIDISDKDAKNYYNENKARFQTQPELKASHILVKTEDEAKKIIASLKDSKNLKADFTKEAKEKSIGPSKVSGGELGWFTQEKMVPEFSMATIMLKKGTITLSPVKTQFGFHVIYLDDKKDAKNLSFDEVKGEIKQFLGQDKFKEKLDAIIKKEKAKAKIIYK